MDAIVVESSFHSTYAVVSVDSIYSVYLTWNTYDTLYFRAFLLWRENIIIVRLQVVVEKYFVRHPYCSKGIYAQQYLNRADLQTSTWLSFTLNTYRHSPATLNQSVQSRVVTLVLNLYSHVYQSRVESSESRRSSFSLDGRDRMECVFATKKNWQGLKKILYRGWYFPRTRSVYST